MDDAVLDTAAAVLLGRGWHCVRFNFRGVGASTGRFSGSGGEGEDLLAVLRWVRDTHPGARILLGGYSFGASVASQLASASDAARILLIAPPIGRMPVELPDEKDALDVIIGDRDAFVDSAALADWPADRVHLIRGADHFFSGRFEELQSAIESTLDAA